MQLLTEVLILVPLDALTLRCLWPAVGLSVPMLTSPRGQLPAPMTPHGPVRPRTLGSCEWEVVGVRGPVAPTPPSGSGWLSQRLFMRKPLLYLTVRAPGLIPALALLAFTH